jgi:ketosteroid isomerase-like protein
VTHSNEDLIRGWYEAVALVEWSATLAGETMDGREVAVFHVRNCKIAEARFYPENPKKFAEFFSKG